MVESTFEDWQKKIKEEESKIRQQMKDTNRNMPEEKIKYFARIRVGPPPDGGWKR